MLNVTFIVGIATTPFIPLDKDYYTIKVESEEENGKTTTNTFLVPNKIVSQIDRSGVSYIQSHLLAVTGHIENITGGENSVEITTAFADKIIILDLPSGQKQYAV